MTPNCQTSSEKVKKRKREEGFQKNLISVQELCDITGYSRGTLYNNKDKYPYIKVGKFIRFLKEETLDIIFGREV